MMMTIDDADAYTAADQDKDRDEDDEQCRVALVYHINRVDYILPVWPNALACIRYDARLYHTPQMRPALFYFILVWLYAHPWWMRVPNLNDSIWFSYGMMQWNIFRRRGDDVKR